MQRMLERIGRSSCFDYLWPPSLYPEACLLHCIFEHYIALPCIYLETASLLVMDKAAHILISV